MFLSKHQAKHTHTHKNSEREREKKERKKKEGREGEAWIESPKSKPKEAIESSTKLEKVRKIYFYVYV